MYMYKYTRRPDATAARDKDSGSGDNVGVRGMSQWSYGRGGEKGNWKTFEWRFPRWPAAAPWPAAHTMQRRGWDERACFSLWLTEQQWFITKRHSHSRQSSLLFLSLSVYVCVCMCVYACVRVNWVRFTYIACASHAVQKYRPPPPSSFRRPVHTENSLGRIYLYRYTRTPTSRKEIPTVRQRAI